MGAQPTASDFPAVSKAASAYLNLTIPAKGHVLGTSQPTPPVDTAESLKRRLRSKDAVSSKDGDGPRGCGFDKVPQAARPSHRLSSQ